MHIIEARNLVKNFGDFQAVKGIDFFVEQGEIFGFLGPNGAGKTTTINMLTGLARPSEGTITIAGLDGVRNIKKVQGIIGIVPDESNLYDDMGGFENLVFCASLYGMKKRKREQRAHELLAQFSLDDTGNRPFKAYSKGMKRKLTIAAGIIHEPRILFLDEPTTGIDVESARQIRQLIATLNEQGTTIFLTTHYIEDAERLCDRIGFIVGGSVVKVSTVQALLTEAQQEHVLQFWLEASGTHLQSELLDAFPMVSMSPESDHTISLRSKVPMDLMPFMHFFDARNIKVREARLVRPSLEEVFVKITGIELARLKKEKEGRK
ncbi:MAG: ABC transporter [Spirochaetae bacterium HGW-Spirochaetae-2]|jgi:ABC-2 type transport system ATP-binding protein|nr:MAG: ABC transporter [Spirochaetae bacterium HGW-Spirochaetae-2]